MQKHERIAVSEPAAVPPPVALPPREQTAAPVTIGTSYDDD